MKFQRRYYESLVSGAIKSQMIQMIETQERRFDSAVNQRKIEERRATSPGETLHPLPVTGVPVLVAERPSCA